MVQCICQICGDSFSAKRSDAKYCHSDACQKQVRHGIAIRHYKKNRENILASVKGWWQENRAEILSKRKAEKEARGPLVYSLICAHCGIKFDAKRPQAKFCPLCRKIVANQQERRPVETTCEQCGASLTMAWADLRAKQKRGKPILCSIQGENDCLSLWRGSKVEFSCDHCGTKFQDFRSNRKSYTFHFCSKQCESESYLHRKTGSAHYRYKDGSTSLSYGEGWTLARRRARKRDNFTCQSCGITEKETGKALDVHHIIPFRDFDDYREANKLINLISFCSSCHHRIEAEQVKEPSITDGLKQVAV